MLTQVSEIEKVTNSGANRLSLYIKRRASAMSNQNCEPGLISPTKEKSLQKDSAWSSTPVLNLDAPQLAQNQLQNQYDVFNSESTLLSRTTANQPGQAESNEDERNIIKSKIFYIWRALRHFFTITSFHGLLHIAGSQSLIKICYWVILILISVGLMLCAIVFISINYFGFDTFFKTELEESNQLKFPAVTICNLNQYAKSYFYRNLGYSEEEIYIATLFADFLSSRTMINNGNVFRNFNITILQLADRYTNDLAAESSTGETLGFTHKLENMLVSCYYNDQPCPKDQFSQMVNINGKCFTFNSDTTDVLYATTPGASHGLELVLNVEQHEFFLSDVDSVGFRVYIHQQGEFPYLGEHAGFTATPGMHTDIILSTQRLEYLEPPYGECRKDLKLDYFSIYTREACLDECRTKVTIRECGCRMFYMPGNATTCFIIDYADCVGSLLQSFSAHYHCDCPSSCYISENYQYALSYSAFPAKHFPLLLHNTGVLSTMPGIPDYIRNLNATNNSTAQNELFKYFKENFVKITLHYNQLSRYKITEVADYEIFQFIADFGSHLGLFTGASFLTFFEFIEICMGIFYPATADRDHHVV